MGLEDGYTNVTTNRTDFPLGQGFITLNSEHPKWVGKRLRHIFYPLQILTLFDNDNI